MKIYEKFDIRDFVLALGYKGEAIKKYFMNYNAYSSDVSVNLQTGEIEILKRKG